MRSFQSLGIASVVALTVAGISAPASGEIGAGLVGTVNIKPIFVGAISSACYDGVSDDLLTAGLGKTGLAGAPPGFANPLAPTAAELRKRAIWTNYRAVLDITAAGGYGTLYGPNVTKDGVVTSSEGRIAGCEYIAYADDGTGKKNVTLMVQIPNSFDPANPCIIAGTSSGSRGVYGAIGAAGEWGLKRACAVAYSDKGTGNGLHDLTTNTVGLINGTRTTAAAAGTASHFTANLTDAQRGAFNAAFPNRVAYKHAHSQQNPEKDWGTNTLQAAAFAFYLLNQQFGTPVSGGVKLITIAPSNTIVIASNVSNGATAALHAAEQDLTGLIDGVAVTEPNAQPTSVAGLTIKQGTTTIPTIGKPLYDYFTYANLYQPCAALAVGSSAPGFAFLNIPNPSGAANRCAGLAAKGLISGATLAAQAASALSKLRVYGWQAEHDVLHASHYRFASNSIAVTYSNALGRFSVADNLCGFSFANTNASGDVIAQDPAPQASVFATGNGVPPTTGVNIVYNNSVGGSKLDLLAVSPSTGSADFALDGAICHRNLVEGRDIVTGVPLTGAMKTASDRVRAGLEEVKLSGLLSGNKPAIVVSGRDDALVPVNHSSRAYYARNKALTFGLSNLRYIEVTNAQHFDAFLSASPLPGYDSRYIPLHVYLNRALDWMYDHLRSGKLLPPSQVVHTVPRGGAPGSAPAITAANVPPIQALPSGSDLIIFNGGTLFVPN